MTITSEGPHEVDLLVPFKNNLPAGGAQLTLFLLYCMVDFSWYNYVSLIVSVYTKECSLEGVAGLLLFAGSICQCVGILRPKRIYFWSYIWSEGINEIKFPVLLAYLCALYCFPCYLCSCHFVITALHTTVQAMSLEPKHQFYTKYQLKKKELTMLKMWTGILFGISALAWGF